MLFQKDIYDGYIKKIDRKKKEVLFKKISSPVSPDKRRFPEAF